MPEEKKPLSRSPKPSSASERSERGERGPKRKVRGNRSPGPKGRITKRTGDERSKPEAAKGRPWDPTRPLPNKVARHLKALGHHLDPVVQVGREGITEAVVRAAREQLLAHELIKVKISADAPVDRKDAGVELAEKAGASLAQTLGRTVLLYKRHPHKPKIDLPR
jgi:RNA-binding protein